MYSFYAFAAATGMCGDQLILCGLVCFVMVTAPIPAKFHEICDQSSHHYHTHKLHTM